MMDFLRAVGLLTVLPVRPSWDERSRAGPGHGVLPAGRRADRRGAGWAGLAAAAGRLPPRPLLPAALILAAWAGLTGGLHLDGWADCCDALFVPASRERRLEILHDPRLGSFGGVGLILLLLVKVAAIQGVPGSRLSGVAVPDRRSRRGALGAGDRRARLSARPGRTAWRPTSGRGSAAVRWSDRHSRWPPRGSHPARLARLVLLGGGAAGDAGHGAAGDCPSGRPDR